MHDQRLLWLLAQAEEHELTTAQVAVLSMLLALDARDRAQVTKAALGALVNLKERQVANVLKELETHVAAFIKKQRSGGAGKGRAANSYAIRPDATSNPVPAAWYLQQSSAGNAVPSASPDQHSNTGNEVLVVSELTPEIPPKINNQTPLELNLQPVEPEANSSTARRTLNGSAKSMFAHDLSTNLIEIVDSHWLDGRYAGLAKTSQILRNLIDDGADFDLDIVPTVVAMCAKHEGEPIRSYRFFEGAIRSAARTRLTLERQTRNPIKPAEMTAHDQQRTGAADEQPRVRREAISPVTAARMRRREEREARNRSIDYGRVESVRVE